MSESIRELIFVSSFEVRSSLILTSPRNFFFVSTTYTEKKSSSISAALILLMACAMVASSWTLMTMGSMIPPAVSSE